MWLRSVLISGRRNVLAWYLPSQHHSYKEDIVSRQPSPYEILRTMFSTWKSQSKYAQGQTGKLSHLPIQLEWTQTSVVVLYVPSMFTSGEFLTNTTGRRRIVRTEARNGRATTLFASWELGRCMNRQCRHVVSDKLAVIEIGISCKHP